MTATRVIAYAPNGASLGPVPTPQDVNVGYPLNDVGALTLNYPPDAPRAALLGQPVELAVEVSWDGGLTWTEPKSSRFMYLRDGRDPIKTGDAFAVEAAGYALRLQKALVGWTSLNSEGVREFTDATPGAILTALWDEAQARGALAGMTRTWSATQDTAGTPWPETFSLAYEPGKDLLAIVQEMAEAGWIDYQTDGRDLEVFIQDHPSGMGADRTTGAAPVSLRFGRDLTEAPFRRTWEALADTAMVAGDNATHLERTNAGAITPWGRQETYVTASGVTDTGTLTTIADAALTLTANERTEHTFGLEFGAAAHLPFRDYAPGEWVYAAVDGSGVQRMRVRQVTLTRGNDGAVGGNVVLNDRFLEADVLQARRIKNLTQGATQAGTGNQPGSSPGGNDILAPAQVTGLSATSAAYVEDDGRVRSQISLDWVDVTTNADGTVTSDVDHYEVWKRRVGVSQWMHAGDVDLSQWSDSPYEPGQDWEFKVRAVDTVFNRGLFSATDVVTTSADNVGPLKPATPTATTRLGTARIAWNGLRDTGAAMDPDFRYVAVHVSQVNGFTPDASTRVGELSAAGYVVAGPLNYQSTYYARLVPYDSSGNAGTPSDQVTITVAALVDVTNFPDDAMEDLYARTGQFLNLSADNFSANLIEGMWLKAGTVEADRLAIGARGQTVMRNSYMEQDDGTGKPANWSTVWGWERVILSGETAAPIAGTRSLRATVNTADEANAFIGDGGNHQPTVGGQKWYARVTVRAVQAMAARRFEIHGTTSTEATQPFGIFDPNVTWHAPGTAGTALGWTAGQVRTLETTWTVPNGHAKANLALRVLGTGAVNDAFVIDNVEMWPAVTDSQVTEVGAGKIKTGLLQATERIVAGGLTGARTELNGLGFQAFRSDGTKTFEVLAATGEVFGAGTWTTGAVGSGTGAGTRVTVGAVQNPYETGQSWGTIQFFPQDADWTPGLIWGAYGTDSGPLDWGTLILVSPRLGSRQPAKITLRSEEQSNKTLIELNALDFHATANTFTWGDSAGNRVVFKIAYAGSNSLQGFSFQSAGGKRIEFNYGSRGEVIIKAEDESASHEVLNLDASTIYFRTRTTRGNLEIIPGPNINNNPGLACFGKNVGLWYRNEALLVKSWNAAVWLPIRASQFAVNSDMRGKSGMAEVKDAVATLQALPAYDYDTPHGQPRKAAPGRQGDSEPAQHRQRGLMAQHVREVLPDAVAEDEDGELSVDVYAVLTTAVAAIQELAAEVDTLKAARSPRKP